MSKAFLFDLDGVLINDEQIWEDKKQSMYKELFGEDVASRLGSTLGVNIDAIYERAISLGANIGKDTVVSAFFKIANEVYETAPIPNALDELIAVLKKLNYRIGIVSASPLSWITTVTKRLSFENDIELIVSLYERPDLAHKPEPDGYLEAMKAFEAEPATTIILEDSNSGIQSAKASGALTIGLRQNLAKGYVQTGADVYANTIKDVVELVQNHTETM
jgi:mannitol-1-/sugar-/sorbitol-6-/2-deoxyglucose-6-phosphatase